MMRQGDGIQDAAIRSNKPRMKPRNRLTNDVVGDTTPFDLHLIYPNRLCIETRVTAATNATLIVADNARTAIEKRA